MKKKRFFVKSLGEKNLNKDFTNTRRGHHFEKFFLKISSFF